MLIEGTISQVTPPDFRDNYNNQYQNITVDTVNGPIVGRKGSKTPYAVQDIGKQVKWECEQASNSRGPYNKFKMPQDPNYPQQPYATQSVPQAPQGSLPAAGQPNASNQGQDRAEGMVRHGVVCAMITGNCVNYTYAIELTNFIMTGQIPPTANPAPPDSDIPF